MSRIRYYIGLLLLKSRWSREIMLFKKWVDLRNSVPLLVNLRLRLLEGCDIKLGEDSLVDDHYDIATTLLLIPGWFESDPVGARKNEEFISDIVRKYQAQRVYIDEIVEKNKSDPVILEAIRTSFSTRWYCAEMLRDRIEADYYAARLQDARLEKVNLSWSNIAAVIKWVRISLAAQRDALGERRKIRIDLSPEDILRWSALFYSFLVVAAFFRTRLFYGSFGVHVNDYFTITDYLAASLDSLGAASVSTLVSVIMMFLGMQRGSSRIFTKSENDQKSDDRVFWFVIFFLVAISISTYFLDILLFYGTLFVPVTIAGLSFSIFLARNVFKNFISTLLVTNFIFTFSGSVFSDTMYSIEKIKRGSVEPCNSYQVVDRIFVAGCSDILLGTTERHWFFYDAKANRTIIIPSDKVEKVVIDAGYKTALELVKEELKQSAWEYLKRLWKRWRE